MILLYKPTIDEICFRESLLSDAETMSYNSAYGGVICFPKRKWKEWYKRWVKTDNPKFFYRYLRETNTNEFVGEVAYHFDETRKIYICEVIVLSKYRGKGYGTDGLNLLCSAAKQNGIDELYDDIAAENPSVNLFLKNGFVIEYKTEEIVMVKKKL